MEDKMSRRELLRRYVLFIISLFISALGVAVTKRGELGVSPISSAANVMSMRLPVLSLGSWLIIWNCILIAGQIALLRRNFKLIQLLQIPLSFLFGWFTDIGMCIARLLPVSGKLFGNVKIIFDISNLTFAAVLSFALFDFKIVGLREGTVIAALLTGVCVKFFTRLYKERLDRMLSDNTQKRNEENAEKSQQNYSRS